MSTPVATGEKRDGRIARFRCTHCDKRIVVPKRHLGRLCRCPECGGVTHPFAGQIQAVRTTCANCEHPFGKLQKRHQFRGETICGPCHRILSEDTVPSTPDVPSPVTTTGIVQRALPAPAPAQVVVTRATGAVDAGGTIPPLAFDVQGAGAVAVFAGFAVTAGAFFFALTLVSYIGGFVTALVFGGLALLGVQWVYRGWLAVGSKLAELRELRARHGTGKVLSAITVSLRSRPTARTFLAVAAVVVCGAIYLSYAATAAVLARALRSRA